jgi:hypothetical protein
MNPPATLTVNPYNDATDLPLRLAQRAFAALIEEPARNAARNHAEFRFAQLRSAARRTLSALSADDQACLARWLALQFVSAAASSPHLARVDTTLAANVDGSLELLRERFFAPRSREVAAA